MSILLHLSEIYCRVGLWRAVFSVYSEGEQRRVFPGSERQDWPKALGHQFGLQRETGRKNPPLCIDLNIENSFKDVLSPSQ